MSSSFFPALKKSPVTPNVSAAWFFWSFVNDLRMPNQLKLTRTAAIVVRNCCAGEVDELVAGSSSTVLIGWSPVLIVIIKIHLRRQD